MADSGKKQSASTAKPREEVRRTAVLVVHGIGNQRPLETLRRAADALYTTDPRWRADPERRRQPKLWMVMGKVDTDRDIDLQHLITANIAGPGETKHYVEFHECYWAHLMSEPRFVAVPLWVFELVKKGPSKMEPRVRPLWPLVTMLFCAWVLSSWFLLLALCGWLTGWNPPLGVGIIAMAAGAVALSQFTMGPRGAVAQALLCAVLAGGLIAWLGDGALDARAGPVMFGALWWAFAVQLAATLINLLFLLTVVGDAARYYRASPSNIGIRREIRSLALSRIDALNSNPKYDRVVVLAHSLGSTIAYDMLRNYWSGRAMGMGDPSLDPVCLAQDQARDDAAFDLAAWRGNAGQIQTRLAGLDDPRRRWRISDLVTIGSPLSQARFLMADGTDARSLEASFERKVIERELPTSPARALDGDGALIARPAGHARSFFHQAGVFAVTRWSNLHFPLRWAVWGDTIGGPVRDSFGPGIDDREVPFGKVFPPAAHTGYFDTTDPDAEHLRALREAVGL